MPEQQHGNVLRRPKAVASLKCDALGPCSLTNAAIAERHAQHVQLETPLSMTAAGFPCIVPQSCPILQELLLIRFGWPAGPGRHIAVTHPYVEW